MSSYVKVVVFVGTRADLGPLTPLLTAMAAARDLDLHLFTGVGYTADALADALPGPFSPREWRARIHELDQPIGNMTVEAMLQSGPRIGAAAARELAHVQPDVLVVLGDRWELLYAVPPAFLAGVPIVHLHGGEVTEGALDERVRHAVSKLADQHCVASRDAADRLAQMGEPHDRIHVTGAPGLDRLSGVEPLDDTGLEVLLGFPVVRPVALFTYHPPTADRAAPVGRWAAEALEATLRRCGTVLATYPGMDPGRDAIVEVLTRAQEREPRLAVVEALGARYPRVLASVDVVVGNSSSGIIEAATVGVPVVNIGDRQEGRLRGSNVIDVAEGGESVAAGLAAALAPDFVAAARAVQNPYGAGDASSRILDIVRSAPGVSRVKPFVDLSEECG